MSAYDPKRPRHDPRLGTGPAPVDDLIDLADAPTSTSTGTPEPAVEDDLRPVPPAPGPDRDLVERLRAAAPVLLAVVAAAVVVAAVLRRRR